jgi:hypothetical protein
MSSNKYICILVVLGSMAYLSINKVKRPFLFICLVCYCLRVQLNTTYNKHKLHKVYILDHMWLVFFPFEPSMGEVENNPVKPPHLEISV